MSCDIARDHCNGDIIYKIDIILYLVRLMTSNWAYKVLMKVFTGVTDQESWGYIPFNQTSLVIRNREWRFNFSDLKCFFFSLSGFIRLMWILPLSHCYVFSQQWIIFSLLLKHVVIFTLQPPNPVLAAHTFLSVTILPHLWPEQRNLWYFWLLLFLHKLRPLPVYTDTCPVYINGYVMIYDDE